jgi:hypothetical protein
MTLETVRPGTRFLQPRGGEACVPHSPSGGRALLRRGRRYLTAVGCTPSGRGPFPRHGGMIEPRGGRIR